MRKIIVSDSYCSFLDILSTNSEIEISLLITLNLKKAEKFKNIVKKIVPRHICNDNLINFYENDYNLSYKEIKEFQSTQSKVETYLSRLILNRPFSQYLYLQALSFYLEFFSKNQIDAVFVFHIEHGTWWDSIFLDIARKKGIPVYILNYVGNDTKLIAYFAHNDDFLNIKEVGRGGN